MRKEKTEISRRIKLETLKKTLELDSLQEMNSLYENLYNNVRTLRKNKVLEDREEHEDDEAEEAEEDEEYEDEDGEIEYDPDAVIDALIKFMETKQGQKDDPTSNYCV